MEDFRVFFLFAWAYGYLLCVVGGIVDGSTVERGTYEN